MAPAFSLVHLHIVSPICPLKIKTTTINPTNQKAEIFNTSLSILR
jgi:hypothetical protein